jgi:hypothetical protein
VLAAYTQLRLARAIAGDQRLPWERPRPQPRLSPLRVRHGFRGCCARRALPRPTQGPLLGTRDARSGDQKPASKPGKKPTKTTKAT